MAYVSKLLTQEEWNSAYSVIRELRPSLEREPFVSSRERMLSKGYELFGLKAENQVVSIVGLIIYPHLERGLDCWIYDLATLEDERSKGFGKEILDFTVGYAKERGCTQIQVHTRLHRADAQRFYEEKAQWEKSAYVYKKVL